LKSGIYSERKIGFSWQIIFLIQGGRDKNGIKKYRRDHHEFRDFWWKFHDFWISGAIKINSEKIKQIKQADQRAEIWSRPLWVQLGDITHSGYNLET
jgi:hypothetical protein